MKTGLSGTRIGSLLPAQDYSRCEADLYGLATVATVYIDRLIFERRNRQNLIITDGHLIKQETLTKEPVSTRALSRDEKTAAAINGHAKCSLFWWQRLYVTLAVTGRTDDIRCTDITGGIQSRKAFLLVWCFYSIPFRASLTNATKYLVAHAGWAHYFSCFLCCHGSSLSMVCAIFKNDIKKYL